MVKNPPAIAGDVGLNPALGRSPEEGHGNPLQYSCLENRMDKEPGEQQSIGSAWQVRKLFCSILTPDI